MLASQRVATSKRRVTSGSVRPCDGDNDLLCWRLVPADVECAGQLGLSEPVRPAIDAYHFFSFNPKIRAQSVVLD